MIEFAKPSDPANSLDAKYDAWNRLVEVEDTSVLVAKFEYDGTGRRILKIYDSQSPADPDGVDACEHYLHTGNQVIETRQANLVGGVAPDAESINPKYQNVWSQRYIDSLILRDENTDPATDDQCDNERIFYVADANYNVTAVVDTSGDVLERYVYTPYGEVTIYDDDWSDTRNTSDVNNTTLYTGREHDPETGLYYYRARYYHAQLGRFIGRDPIGYNGGINLYAYAFDSPLAHTDPLGLDTTPTWPALPPYDPTKGTGGVLYSDWLDQFWSHTSIDPSQATQTLKDAFQATVKRGCIGVAAVVAGYSNIDEFMKQLNEGYWSEAKATKEMKKKNVAMGRKNVKGARDVYGEKLCATLVAIQFGVTHWIKPVPANWNASKDWYAVWDKKNFGAEPVDLTKRVNWDAVNNGIGMIHGRPKNMTGTFDVQVYSPRIGLWLGGSRGEDRVAATKVFSLTDAELKTHIARGDQKNYTMHLWLVVPEKAYNKK